MAEDGFKNIVFGLVIFSGFVWLILSIAVGFGEEYGRDSQEIGDGALDLDNFESSIENVSDNAENYRERFESGNVEDVDDASGIFAIATDIITMITTPFTLLGNILENIFNVPKIITNIILGLLGIALILGIWRVLRTGA